MDELERRRFPEIKKETNEIISQYSKICDGLYKWMKCNDSIDDMKYLIESWLRYETIHENDSY